MGQAKRISIFEFWDLLYFHLKYFIIRPLLTVKGEHVLYIVYYRAAGGVLF